MLSINVDKLQIMQNHRDLEAGYELCSAVLISNHHQVIFTWTRYLPWKASTALPISFSIGDFLFSMKSHKKTEVSFEKI